MRRRDRSGDGLEPAAAAALAAMDAAVAGEPSDPGYAELCEVALLVAAERPVVGAGELASLERAVQTRFSMPARRAGAEAARPTRRGRRGFSTWRGWSRGAQGGVAAALAAGALAAVVVSLPGGGAGSSSSTSSSVASSAAGGSARSSAGAIAQSSSSASVPTPAPAPPHPAATSSNSGNFFGGPSAAAGTAPTPPHAPGRQVVQGAQLALAAPAARIDTVSQEVFDVVGTENGIVQSSTVNSGGAANAYASFSLSIPSANLPVALRLLSTLRGASVLSRTDTTSDITGTVGATGQRLAEERALRRSLLARLASATTSAEVASLQGRLHDVDGRIAADAGKLTGLHRQVADSHVTVTIQPAAGGTIRPAAHSSGLTLGRALHVAGRVLVVAAAVALIALAVLVPLGLLAALGAWIWTAVRRRRREAALDLL